MGFLDKLKSATSALTGSAAQVSIHPEPLSYQQPFSIRVVAVIGEQEISSKGIYLHVEGIEEVQIPNVQVRQGDASRSQTIHRTNRSVLIDYPIGEAQMLQSGRTYEWTQVVELPPGTPALYEGTLARHYIRARAGIDCFGNDPDSSWIELHP